MLESLRALPEADLNKILAGFTEAQHQELLFDWSVNGRPKQLMPGTPGAAIQTDDWRFWLVLAGRGFGKTRTGAETVREWARNPKERILMVAPTASDVREVMIEGESGLMSCYPPGDQPVYIPSRHLVQFPSGAIGITRSADEPERLRGPQFGKFWLDEMCAWRFAQKAWDQLQFGFRKKSLNKLRGIITTTPKPTQLLKSLIENPKTVVTTGSSYENRSNLADEYYADVIRPYEGTRLGRQEINAEILTDVPGALWTRQLIDATRIPDIAQVRWDLLLRIVVAIDPAVTHREGSDETGIIVAALTKSEHVVILDDLSLKGSPLDWAKIAIAAYRSRRADVIVGEVNNGGDLVGANIHAVDPSVNFRAVRASRGKYLRAEPVAALYEQGRVHHVGFYGVLEDQMTQWTPQSNERSPDRLDALVWAVTELLIDHEASAITVRWGEGYGISPI